MRRVVGRGAASLGVARRAARRARSASRRRSRGASSAASPAASAARRGLVGACSAASAAARPRPARRRRRLGVAARPRPSRRRAGRLGVRRGVVGAGAVAVGVGARRASARRLVRRRVAASRRLGVGASLVLGAAPASVGVRGARRRRSAPASRRGGRGAGASAARRSHVSAATRRSRVSAPARPSSGADAPVAASSPPGASGSPDVASGAASAGGGVGVRRIARAVVAAAGVAMPTRGRVAGRPRLAARPLELGGPPAGWSGSSGGISCVGWSTGARRCGAVRSPGPARLRLRRGGAGGSPARGLGERQAAVASSSARQLLKSSPHCGHSPPTPGSRTRT